MFDIIAIQNNFKGRDAFYFIELEKEEIQKEIHELNKLNTNKASNGIPTKLIKSNSDILSDFLYVSITASIKSPLFPTCLKTASIRKRKKT